MKAAISSKENITELPSTITKENMHLYPKDTQDFCALLEKDKNRIFSPKKYLPAQKSLVLKKVNKIYQKQPSTPLKKVIISILSDLPDFLLGDNLLLVTGYIVEEWGRLQGVK